MRVGQEEVQMLYEVPTGGPPYAPTQPPYPPMNSLGQALYPPTHTIGQAPYPLVRKAARVCPGCRQRARAACCESCTWASKRMRSVQAKGRSVC
eukprot:54588-Rhodomonas_salina.1